MVENRLNQEDVPMSKSETIQERRGRVEREQANRTPEQKESDNKSREEESDRNWRDRGREEHKPGY